MKSNPYDVVEIEDRDLGFKGWVYVNTLNNGLAFGGCRFDMSVTAEVVENLAECMTWKLAAHGLPVGGAKGGLQVDTSNPNLDLILKKFAQGARRVLTQNTIIGKDLGATNEILDALYNHLGVPQLHVVQNRPGSQCRATKLRDFTGYQPHMTGFGVAIATRAALDNKIRSQKVIIQGCGAVGIGAAVRLHAMGAKIIGISDKNQGVHCPSSFAIPNLIQACKGGVLKPTELKGEYEVLTSEELLARKSDILVLAASSNCITEKIAASFDSEFVVEGANFPLLQEARDLLHKNGIMVVPDILANSSSAAMVAHQMLSENQIPHEKLWYLIENSIHNAVLKSLAIAKAEHVTAREAYIEYLVPRVLQDMRRAA